jgi:hypothetical protein
MKTPMPLVHGEADNNPGTFTLQTERYFQALKAGCSCTNGNSAKEARLCNQRKYFTLALGQISS